MIVAVPVIRRYDLLWRFLSSVERSTLQPSQVIIIDNGGSIREHMNPEKDFQLNVSCLDFKGNIGCSAAWNVALDMAHQDEFVIISNDDMDLHPDSLGIIDAGRQRSEFVAGYGFSLFGISRGLYSNVGPFDENFYPAYFEDNDYTYRMKLAGVQYAVVDAKASPSRMWFDQPMGSASLHCLSAAEQEEFSRRFDKLRSYYIKKWGGAPGKERFKQPFNGKPPVPWYLRAQQHKLVGT